MAATETSSFGALLRGFRLVSGLTQEALAERAGLSVEAIGTLERGTRTMPRRDTVTVLAKALRLTPADRARLEAAVARARHYAAGETLPRMTLLEPLTSFVGREREVARLRSLLGPCRLVTLTGPPGVGKTRLAIEAARVIADDYADGVAFIPLATVHDPEMVLPFIAAALGVRMSDPAKLATALAVALRSRHLLLVLDNVEQVAAAAPDMAALVAACPRLVALVTSRVRLRVRGEREVAVAPLAAAGSGFDAGRFSLAVGPAVALFVERARDIAPDFALTPEHAAVVQAICQRLGGLPLAIELAAPRLKVLPPAALLAHLERSLPLLTSGAQDLPARQQSMHRAIAWSYDLLAESEQRFFRHLGVFVGGCTLAAIAAVADGKDDPLAALNELVEQSLVQRQQAGGSETRYGLLEPLREFALERLAEAGEADEAHLRHALHFLAMAETTPLVPGPQHAAWLWVLEADYANCRQALDWLGARGYVERALRLASALTAAWFHAGHAAEGLRLLRPLLAVPGAAGPTATRAAALETAGWWTYALATGADMRAARALYEEALAIRRALGDLLTVARVQARLGWALYAEGDHAAVRAVLAECLPVLRTAGDAEFVGWSLSTLGSVALDEGADDQAEASHAECLALWRQQGYRLGEASALLSLGAIARRKGEAVRARGLYQEALAIHREVGDRNNIWFALDALGTVALEGGEFPTAENAFREMLAPLLRMGYTHRVSQTLESLACLAAALGNYERAVRLAGAAERLGEMYGREWHTPWHPEPECWLTPARAALGEVEAGGAQAAGRALSLEQAIAAALEDEPPNDR